MNRCHRILAVCVVVSLGLGCQSSHREDHPPKPDSLEDVADVNRFDEYGWGTPLYQAVSALDVDAVRYLLSIGADVNKGTEDGETPLHVAAGSESEKAFEIVKILVSHRADVNAKIKSKELSDGTVSLAEGYTPLHEAASVWCPSGEDLESRENSAVVDLLVAHGADVNARDADGCTPLFHTLFAGCIEVIELLVEHGTDLNVKNNLDGGTVLHDAASNGDLEVVRLFVSHGADVDARDFEGETPLHEAALRRDRETVDYLVSQGADLHTPSKRGETPHDFLSEPNNVEPILLAGSDTYPLTLIRTNRLHVRPMLKSAGVDYDTLWTPSASDIEGLDRSLRRWLEEETPDGECRYVDRDYILSHFDQYHREYAGFVKDGTRYIFGSMVQVSTDRPVHGPLRNAFVSVLGRGCVQACAIFAAHSKTVVAFRCGWHVTPETTAQ